ncbi:MAG: hypothetical protein GY750_15000 [Lentisphaerae bacterium]|nr:hypothetical protein [Lentisphaerota bacterium]
MTVFCILQNSITAIAEALALLRSIRIYCLSLKQYEYKKLELYNASRFILPGSGWPGKAGYIAVSRTDQRRDAGRAEHEIKRLGKKRTAPTAGAVRKERSDQPETGL